MKIILSNSYESKTILFTFASHKTLRFVAKKVWEAKVSDQNQYVAYININLITSTCKYK